MGLFIVVFTLHIVNFILHGFGSYVLTRISRRRDSKPHLILLLSLSVTEAVMNLLEAINDVPAFTNNLPKGTERVFSVTYIIALTGTWIFLYYIMHCVVIDRLLVVVLSFKYKVFVTRKKIVMVVLIGALVALISTTITLVATIHFDFDWKSFYFKVVYNILHGTFITLSVGSYGYIFYKFQKSRKQFSRSTEVGVSLDNQSDSTIRSPEGTSHAVSTLQIFRASNFYISIVLVSTYIIFLIVPDLVYLLYGVKGDNISETLENACWLAWTVGNLIDFFTYLLMPPRVRKELKVMFGCEE